MPVISFRHVCKAFGDKPVLDDVSFDVRSGEVFFIIGASGAGKSVLIKHLVGLLAADSGEIWLDGSEVTGLSEAQMYAVRKKCAMVFQHSTLFDSMTCAENVALPVRKHRALSPGAALAEAHKLLERVKMEKFADRYPGELGDGMRKRVAIARALGLEPVTSLVVSHDLSSIFGIADRIVMLYKGKVRQLGTRAQFLSTEDPVVQEVIQGRADGPMEA